MTLSDQLATLAARVKDLEDRVGAAKKKTKAELEVQVKHARESAQQRADALHTKAEQGKGEVSDRWHDVRKSWNQHITEMHEHADDKRAAHDVKSAQKAAERAEDDADFAVTYAIAAVDEAEYAVLDAILARMDADDLAGVGPNS